MPTKRVGPADLEAALRETDWDAFDALTDDDIARAIEEDPDAAPDTSDIPADAWTYVEAPDVAAVRARYGLSRDDFAHAFGVSPATLREWERGKRRPEGPARVLLRIMAGEPEAVRRVLKV